MCVFSYREGDILWKFFKSGGLKCGGDIIFVNDSNGFYWICVTLRANVFLSGYGYNKFIICRSLCRGGYSSVSLRGV